MLDTATNFGILFGAATALGATLALFRKLKRKEPNSMQRKYAFLVEVEFHDDGNAVVNIGCDTLPMPFDAVVAATEHMMTSTALLSQAGFEKALELMVEGAKSNQVKMTAGIKPC